MNDLVSIVLPVYNGERFLRESINSVIAQTHQNWELIVVDDCSKDATPQIVQEYECRDARIHYYRNETNLKLPRNLNRGFSLTKGDYLTWTSDDNLYRPQAIEKMLCTLKQNTDAGLVYASYQVIDENGKRVTQFNADPKGREHILGGNVVGACFMYTRQVYEAVGDYDPDLFLLEDFDYWQRVFMSTNPVAIEEILYDYRWHEASLTSTKNECVYGKTLEKMLLKNRIGYGKLSPESDFLYKRSLVKAADKQNKKYKYKGIYLLALVRFFLYRHIHK